MRKVSSSPWVTAEDGESIPDDSVFEADVAIVGAGAAGITIAREFAGSRLKVLLIESGGWEPEDRFQTLSRGEIFGDPYWPLHENRQRCVGGTTNHWTGWCRPLDELDMSVRDWIPRSGWPITRASLVPYYERAHEVCELGPSDYGVESWERRLGARRLLLDERTVTTKMFQLSPPTRFGPTYMPVLLGSGNVGLIYHATVVEIETTPEAGAVTALEVGTLSGRRFRVRARDYVLAAGGLENARLLLVSDRHRRAGLGNDHDQVGRYFMEHLHFSFGVAVIHRRRRSLKRLYSPDGRAGVGRIFLTPELQRERGVLHGNVSIDASVRGNDSTRLRVWLDRLTARFRRATLVRLHHTIEQPPDLSSRVTLGAEPDAFGSRRMRLDWRVGEAERRTFRTNWRALGSALESAGLGRVVILPEDDVDAWPPLELQGQRGHHMGTTRMSTDPKLGVVDANCRVHGTPNLFVAGSSVFPTAGAGTPTLTIVALALRLADHLRSIRRS